ncbi:NAD(P)/FAD-dependent oxidoreductase [Cellulomonas xiejunii]|uniref:NADH:ubiquinone reductase (non-electrogenic) n=1 Tax=Cellulomonas xiejunii TaxID=2968083 RepID=A0ABY5KXF7_9CELL|nr:NAD(P)/FAD-dependent oxidoreductase [Cellulomonas xiejunii]MCC2315124.1 NAD(P)/FAD-dependent oxidoreductase [Cellulomonas xiejunii]MCC2315671.1 NAD(P)/FAD-dependent oxidoreductase [Cellulomonas xiejunii]MCC2321734.1 NAD(P)/FAD-dependent oxidoreductase [Cellulomonas xiejunii]UUI73043.1 NAD(P)/FAD-dependent oxidoreductase [Cellulomonas xiejunii]
MASTQRPHDVVVVGSGFGGLFTTRALARVPGVRVTVVSGVNHHLFQPLLYQVATGILSAGEVAPATRDVLRLQRNARVVLGVVEDVDLDAREVVHRSPMGVSRTRYDSLVVAAGAGQSYFGNDRFAEHAPGLKSLDDAMEVRARIFGAFEMAELTDDPEVVDRLLTFVVVGAGPTGVEMAGQVAELAHRVLPGEFRRIDPTKARILLVDPVPQVLPGYPDELAAAATRELEHVGVEVWTGWKVVDVDEASVTVEDDGGQRRVIPSVCKVWAAGVAGAPVGRVLAERAGIETTRSGQVPVEDDCTLPGHPEVFVIGDLMRHGKLPGVAQVAIQSGQHAADQIRRRLADEPTGQEFVYRDKGSMATVSRFFAVAQIGSVRTSGLAAWGLWLGVHLLYLVGFKNRVTTLLHWAVSFVGRARSERASTWQQVVARNTLRRTGESALGSRADGT